MKLPHLKDIVAGTHIKTEYEKYINQDPPKEWIVKIKDKSHEGEELDHLPEDKVIILLNAIYGVDGWREEVLREHITRSATFTNEHTALFITRLHIRNPENGNWHSFDGAGSASTIGERQAYNLQQCAQFSIPNATMNAARKIGRIFGGELYEESRKRNAASRIIVENSKTKNSKIKTEAEKVISQIKKTKTGEELPGFRSTIENLIEESAVDESEVVAMTEALENQISFIEGNKKQEIEPKKSIPKGIKVKKTKADAYESVLSKIRSRKRGDFVNIQSQIVFLFKQDKFSADQKATLETEIELQKRLIDLNKKTTP